MRASVSFAPGDTATEIKGKKMGIEDERAAFRRVLVFLVVPVVLEVARLAAVTVLSVTTGIATPEESSVRVELQVVPRPFVYH